MGGASVNDMFGIKLIWPDHLDDRHHYFFRSSGPDLPALMNFKKDAAGYALANRVPIGHRSLIYVTEIQRFIWAIEFTGTVQDGEAARLRHKIGAKEHHPFSIYRPIRFVARIKDWGTKGATRTSVCAKSGVDFSPSHGDSLIFLTREDYDRMYAAIPWTEELA